jgi:DNA-binding GntR family transcriptional regulator
VNQAAPQDKYLRVAGELLARIRAGEFGEDGKIPTVTELMQQYDVSKSTAQQAVGTLSARGYVIAKVGSGTFVRRRPQLTALTRLFDRGMRQRSPFFEEMAAQGRRGHWDVHTRTVQSTPEDRERLGLPEPSGQTHDLQESNYLFRADGHAVMRSRSLEPLDLVLGTEIYLPEEGPFAGLGVQARMLAIGVQITRATELVGARRATPEEARELQISPQAIVLTIERSFEASGRIVEVADIALPADTFKLSYSWEIDRQLNSD